VKKLIITGDDFGLSLSVNEAIEEAHRRGILTTASLMVGAKATADAVERAKRLPSLKVGLHLVLVDGSPVLAREAVPDLVTGKGELSSHLIRAGIHFFFRPTVRQQLEKEIRAQFQAFQDTGLLLDHVNSHHHIHLHPTVLGLILRVGREYGMKAMRLPYEPPLHSWRASRKGLLRKLMAWLCLFPWLTLLKARLREADLRWNNFVFGMNDSGHMHLDLVLRFVRYLPEGVTEIYFHPAIDHRSKNELPLKENQLQDELEVLTHPTLRQALLASDIERFVFSDL
jgi:hopanoid biosynthesis associated protein HpnK